MVKPDDPYLIGATECYQVNRSASWYHPEHCHAFDHHEWIHAQLARKVKDLDGAYEAMKVSNDLGSKSLDMLRALYAATGDGAPPGMSARIKTLLAAADWHDALKNFMDGNEQGTE